VILLVSIHDVAPPNLPAVRRLWQLCRDAGIIPALLVVPDWHGSAPMERDADFVAWLREAVADGAEVLLHGERHDEQGRPRGLGDALRAAGRTAREGECLTLDAPELEALVARGLARLGALGFAARGFVPPAWLMRADARRGVYAAGVTFTEDERAIYLADGRRIATPALRWSTRTAFRARASLLVAECRWRMQRRAPVVRIALHPADLSHPAVARSVAQALVRWTTSRMARSYASLVA
jgi:predicted deacetylase